MGPARPIFPGAPFGLPFLPLRHLPHHLPNPALGRQLDLGRPPDHVPVLGLPGVGGDGEGLVPDLLGFVYALGLQPPEAAPDARHAPESRPRPARGPAP